MRDNKKRSSNVLFRRRARTVAQRHEPIAPSRDPDRPRWPLAVLMTGVAISFAWSLFLAWCCVVLVRWLIG